MGLRLPTCIKRKPRLKFLKDIGPCKKGIRDSIVLSFDNKKKSFETYVTKRSEHMSLCPSISVV